MERAGEGWALTDLARHSNPADAEAALAAAQRLFADADSSRWPARLRPLGMLAVLAARDAAQGLEKLEPPGAPGRMLRMLRHRFTGR
jgi:phytoene synthase